MPAPPKPARHLNAVERDEPASPSSPRAHLAGLVSQAKRGDQEAWAHLYRHTHAGLYRHLGYLLQDPTLAEELTQECFARACTQLDKFDERSRFETWLHGIGVNVVRNYWRGSVRRDRAHQRLSRVLDSKAPVGNPELSHARKQRAAALLEVVAELPPKLREAYVLVDLRELPREEVAAQLGITVGNLSVRISRARAKVCESLQQLGWIGEESSSCARAI